MNGTKPKPRSRGAPVRTAREQWIEEGARVLAASSVEKVRVEVLAKRLGVTKGGFYNHFADREELLQAILDAWRARDTRRVTAWLRRTASDPDEALGRLTALASQDRPDVPGGALEAAIRAWAREDAAPRAHIAEVDAERIAFLAELHRRRGTPQAEAEALALLTYTFRIGVNTLAAASTPEALRAARARCEALLAQPDLLVTALAAAAPAA